MHAGHELLREHEAAYEQTLMFAGRYDLASTHSHEDTVLQMHADNVNIYCAFRPGELITPTNPLVISAPIYTNPYENMIEYENVGGEELQTSVSLSFSKQAPAENLEQDVARWMNYTFRGPMTRTAYDSFLLQAYMFSETMNGLNWSLYNTAQTQFPRNN